MNIQEKHLIDLLQVKHREDPDGFRKYMPDVAELLPGLPPSRAKRRLPLFVLTERERSYHQDGLSETLGKLGEGTITSEEAVKGLQHCADLIRDDSLPDEADYESLKCLARAALGKSPGSYRSKTTVPLDEGSKGPILERVSAIRGVYLDLDRDRRLVSVTIHPGKVKERSKLMKLVGIVEDPERDVAAKHDDYLTMQGPHSAV